MEATDKHITVIPLFYQQLGANGYIYAIDPNGYLLLHPNLQLKVVYILLKK